MQLRVRAKTLQKALRHGIALVLMLQAALVDAALSPAGVTDLGKNAVYFEFFGKSGIWGLGYDHLFGNRLALGVSASYTFLDGQGVTTLSPYFNLYPGPSGAGRVFLQAGPQFTRQSVYSSLPEWSGMSVNKFSGQIGAGWEYRASWLFRGYGMLAAGGEGLMPWMGITMGWVF